jgi:hypothetical protein
MKYLGVKLIDAEPMTHGQYVVEKYKGPIETEFSKANKDKEGYRVTYTDGYVAWSPKEVFEKAYMPLTDPEGKSIRVEDIDNFVANFEPVQYGEKTTVVHATLKNGFILSEASSCVEPENFSMEVGQECCLERIYTKVWQHLGFLLQCGRKGFKG